MLPTSDCIYQPHTTFEECRDDLLCTEEEVIIAKSNGPDGISARMLKTTATSIASSLCKLLNLSIMKGHLPATWKMSSVVTIPKDSDKSVTNSYRPFLCGTWGNYAQVATISLWHCILGSRRD